jgi:hypothetical protein
MAVNTEDQKKRTPTATSAPAAKMLQGALTQE